MAQFQPFYIPSCSEGKTWRVYFHKPGGRPSYVAAYEGELDTDGIYITVFGGPNAGRNLKVSLPGRATLRAVTDAGLELLRQMADSGYITADAASEYTPCLVK